MTKCIVDSCVLVNLYAGWGNLAELRAFGNEWYVCEAVAREVQYVRDFDAAGNPILLKIDLQSIMDEGLIVSCRPESSEEVLANVEFAIELDDGEAQALALAQHRKLIFLTDERPALKFAARPTVGVRTMTTPALLHEWASFDPANEAQMRVIVRKITIRARYAAPRDSPLFGWWQGYLHDP